MKSAKVALIKCESYNSEKVYKAVKRGLKLLGGIEKFVNKDDKILLKPNLLLSRDLISPHPSVFEAIIRILRENKYKKLSYGDSPGFGSLKSVAEKNGLKQVADKYKVKLANFREGKMIKVPNAKINKEFNIAKGVLNSDSIISVSKMKTHQLTGITGAIKNQYGCVQGFEKKTLHAKYPSVTSFSKMLVDLNLFLRPKLFIMDGIIAMQGNGPSGGEPYQMNFILISDDPVALDTVFCELINLKPKYIPTIVYGDACGLGNMNNIKLLGDKLEVKKDFDVQRYSLMEKRMGFMGVLDPLLKKPVINPEKCIRCGTCVKVCPVKEKAVNFKDGDKTKPPIYDYSICIRCFTCQEMCPANAISVKTPLLGRILLYRK